MSNKFERGMIGRTVVFTHCSGMCVRDGEFKECEFEMIGDYADTQRATNALRRRTGDPSITITGTECKRDYYAIPVSMFIATALDYRKEHNHDQ